MAGWLWSDGCVGGNVGYQDSALQSLEEACSEWKAKHDAIELRLEELSSHNDEVTLGALLGEKEARTLREVQNP